MTVVEPAQLVMVAGNVASFVTNPSTQVFYDLPTNGVARVQVSGAYTGFAVFEETLDGLNWFASPFAFADAALTAGAPMITAAGGTFTIKLLGSQQLRVRCTGTGTGTAIILLVLLNGSEVGLNPFATPAVVNGGATFTPPVSSTTNSTLIPAGTSSTQILAANTARLAASVVNDSTSSSLFLSLNGVAASYTAWNYKVGPGSVWTPPINFTGVVYGVWDIAVGQALTTEYFT